MAIVNYDEERDVFEYSPDCDIQSLVAGIQSNLFSEAGFHVVKGFIDPSIASRIREFYFSANASAFQAQRSPTYVFSGQSSIYYYPKSPYSNPAFMTSIIRKMSILRNRVFRNERVYEEYCSSFKLDPDDYEEVLRHQDYHTWTRLSWYREHDGQCTHRDNYGELATFLILTKKGEHWKRGGLFLYDEDNNKTLEVDALCEPGDLLMLDQHRVIHGVEPIIGATPGRLLIYVPIIPYGYIQKWFAFEGFPWRVCFSEKDTAPWERGAAYCKNALDVLMNRQKIHSTRKLFKHHSHCLGTYSKNQEDPHEVVSVRK